MRKIRWNSIAVICCLGAALLGGCGPDNPRGTLGLEGDVTFQGKPLDQGTIEFTAIGEGAAAHTGAVIENGRYSVPAHQGLPPGTYRVRISSLQEDPAGATPEAPGMPMQGAAQPEELIPQDYSGPESTQEITVSDDSTEFNFDIR